MYGNVQYFDKVYFNKSFAGALLPTKISTDVAEPNISCAITYTLFLGFQDKIQMFVQKFNF